MKFKSFILLCSLFALVLLALSTEEVETSKDERNAGKGQEDYHVNDGYGGYGGGGYGGPGGGGWGGRGGGYYGGGGWGGPGGGWGGGGGRGGCRFGCCGRSYGYRGCSRCCLSLAEAIAFNEQEATP